ERRLRELVETGELAEVAQLREETAVEVAAFGELVGLGAKRSATIARSLGVGTVEEFEEAARKGRLREVPGIGPKTEARILPALARGRAPARVPLSRAREVTTQVAAALGGLEAGDARRWLEQARRLAVVVASDDAAAIEARFAALPEIVTTLDRGHGLTVDGVAIELVVAPAAALGTALLRATG